MHHIQTYLGRKQVGLAHLSSPTAPFTEEPRWQERGTAPSVGRLPHAHSRLLECMKPTSAASSHRDARFHQSNWNCQGEQQEWGHVHLLS